jgi:hypothetical protein
MGQAEGEDEDKDEGLYACMHGTLDVKGVDLEPKQTAATWFVAASTSGLLSVHSHDDCSALGDTMCAPTPTNMHNKGIMGRGPRGGGGWVLKLQRQYAP